MNNNLNMFQRSKRKKANLTEYYDRTHFLNWNFFSYYLAIKKLTIQFETVLKWNIQNHLYDFNRNVFYHGLRKPNICQGWTDKHDRV